jgi:hypothetical protein
MKIVVRATVVFEWEEDSKNWEEAETPEALLALVKDYVKGDMSYILDDSKITGYTIEIKPPT